MSAGRAWTSKEIPPIASLGQGVGSETEPDFGIDDVFDDLFVFPRIQIVNQLGALVAEEPGVFELAGAFHGFQRY